MLSLRFSCLPAYLRRKSLPSRNGSVVPVLSQDLVGGFRNTGNAVHIWCFAKFIPSISLYSFGILNTLFFPNKTVASPITYFLRPEGRTAGTHSRKTLGCSSAAGSLLRNSPPPNRIVGDAMQECSPRAFLAEVVL